MTGESRISNSNGIRKSVGSADGKFINVVASGSVNNYDDDDADDNNDYDDDDDSSSSDGGYRDSIHSSGSNKASV